MFSNGNLAFYSVNDFEFGSRFRNYGHLPRNRTGIKEWYELFIENTISLSLDQESYSSKSKVLLADIFRGLWVQVKMSNELDLASRSIVKTGD